MEDTPNKEGGAEAVKSNDGKALVAIDEHEERDSNGDCWNAIPAPAKLGAIYKLVDMHDLV